MFSGNKITQLWFCFVLLVHACQEIASAGMVNESNTAVVVNVDDPLSVKIAAYYQKMRHIPAVNIIRVHIGTGSDVLSVSRFRKIEDKVLKQVAEDIKAYVLTWARPYRVGCMSITSAFSLGYDTQYCATACNLTRKSEYFNSVGGMPDTDYPVRPSMMLAADTLKQAESLIDRGVQSDYTRPWGRAYLLDTSDKARNVRAVGYPEISRAFDGVVQVDIVDANAIENRNDVLFYFTGLKFVDGLDTLRFMPGAAADHLTSLGGVMHGASQMSSLKWLQAGATASYGTVVEPCNYPAKFPNPGVLMQHYLNGDTLVEAYWKSVLMPGQGVFIGEPLAKPFGGCRLILATSYNKASLVNGRASLLPMRENTGCERVPDFRSNALH